MVSVGSGRSSKSGKSGVVVGLYWRGGCDSCAVVCGGVKFVRLWGSDDYAWVVVKELEFGVRYKRLRWGWLCGGVKFVCVGLCVVVGLCMVIAVRLAWRLSDWVLIIFRVVG